MVKLIFNNNKYKLFAVAAIMVLGGFSPVQGAKAQEMPGPRFSY